MKTALNSLYLLILGASIGAILGSTFSAASIFSAPQILDSANAALDGLSTFHSGLIMSQIFVKTNFLLLFCSAFIVLFEIYSCAKEKALLSPILGVISIAAILIFALYFSPNIIEAQNLGAQGTQSEEFNSLHEGSVIAYKIALFALVGLFLVRVFALAKKTKTGLKFSH